VVPDVFIMKLSQNLFHLLNGVGSVIQADISF
jgi:hypothetical protein